MWAAEPWREELLMSDAFRLAEFLAQWNTCWRDTVVIVRVIIVHGMVTYTYFPLSLCNEDSLMENIILYEENSSFPKIIYGDFYSCRS
jgi:hypothetical protein